MAPVQLNRFDRIAPFYDRLTSLVFGSSLVKAQQCNYDLIGDYSKVLVLGGGTGKFLNKLLAQNNGATVWYVEASQKMLEKAKDNLKCTDRVIFIHGTHENVPGQQFDVVITHFFVDMFTEVALKGVVHQIHHHLKDEGKWLVADFVNHNYWHRVFLKLMYGFFNLIGAIDLKVLPAWDRIIQDRFFKKVRVGTFYRGFIKVVAYIKV